jgi:hypothetical protein
MARRQLKPPLCYVATGHREPFLLARCCYALPWQLLFTPIKCPESSSERPRIKILYGFAGLDQVPSAGLNEKWHAISLQSQPSASLIVSRIGYGFTAATSSAGIGRQWRSRRWSSDGGRMNQAICYGDRRAVRDAGTREQLCRRRAGADRRPALRRGR